MGLDFGAAGLNVIDIFKPISRFLLSDEARGFLEKLNYTTNEPAC